MRRRATPRHKFNAQPTEVDGIRFDSKKEATRYRELKLRERAGEIVGLTLQPAFTLHSANGVAIGTYKADFAYNELRGRIGSNAGSGAIVEDVKGFKTPLYRWKKKHVEAEYRLTIREV